MRLVQVVEDTTMFVSGYEHHTWQCSACSTVEQRMTFTHKKTPIPTVVEPIQTIPAQTVPVEPTQTEPGEPSQTTPVETEVPVEATQTVPAGQTIHDRQPPRLQENAWAKAIEKLQKRETAASEAERRTEFNRFWDNLRSVPYPSRWSEALTHQQERSYLPSEVSGSRKSLRP